MKSLYGHGVNKLDGQSRFQTPLDQYEVMFSKRGEETSMILTAGPDRCLYAFTPKIWEYYVSQMRNINLPHDQKIAMLRKVLSFATRCKVDAQRRVRIPDRLLEYSGIKKEVEIIGFMDRLELWAPQVQSTYQSKIEKDDFDYDESVKKVFIDMMPKDIEDNSTWESDVDDSGDDDNMA